MFSKRHLQCNPVLLSHLICEVYVCVLFVWHLLSVIRSMCITPHNGSEAFQFWALEDACASFTQRVQLSLPVSSRLHAEGTGEGEQARPEQPGQKSDIVIVRLKVIHCHRQGQSHSLSARLAYVRRWRVKASSLKCKCGLEGFTPQSRMHCGPLLLFRYLSCRQMLTAGAGRRG